MGRTTWRTSAACGSATAGSEPSPSVNVLVHFPVSPFSHDLLFRMLRESLAESGTFALVPQESLFDVGGSGRTNEDRLHNERLRMR